ncbi:MAG: DNA repair and recombination protein RadB [Candidatus Aenigmarchaeota archaeon]|nr:DNA repair and recombination protein RadB [Candidatus Aenigmarchaeota archaeon]
MEKLTDRLPTKTPLDKILNGGLEIDTITNVYGPPGSGKTNIALCTVLGVVKNNKSVYIDTEGSFSYERFAQLGGTQKDMKNIFLLQVHDWDEQHKIVQSLEKMVEKEDISLIVIDSLVALYRLHLDDTNFSLVNRQLATQYSVLSKITRKHKIPVLVTNQVYTKDDKVELTSRTIARYWSKTLVELRKLEKDNHRVAIVRKHRSIGEGKAIEFKIVEKGLEETKKFDIF